MKRTLSSDNLPLGSRQALALVILACILLFGGLSAWAIWSMSREAAKEADTSPVSPAAGAVYTAADARTLLLITEDEAQAQGFVLVRFDPASARLRTLAIPRETVVDAAGTAGKRLFELYPTQKSAGMTACVQRLTGLPIDYYAAVSYDDLETLLNRASGGLSFTLPENLLYDMGRYTIRIAGGQQVLSATQVTDVLRYPAWNGGLQQRTAVQAQIISACINQYFTPDAIEQDNGYEAFVAVADTNLLREAYHQSRDALADMAAKNTGAICQSLAVSGAYSGSGANVRFALETPVSPAIRTAFGGAASGE